VRFSIDKVPLNNALRPTYMPLLCCDTSAAKTTSPSRENHG
jgi:hypothetical protein